MRCVLLLLMHLVEGPAPLPRSVGEDPPEDVVADQDTQEAEPAPPPAPGVPERPFRPRYAPGPSLRLGVLALRPSVSYDTREYFTGVYSGDVDLRPGADLPRMAPGMIFSLDLGPVRVDGGFVQTAARRRLDRALSYEEETFPPGETVDILAQAGWLDVTYRLRLAGDERSRTGICALLGIDTPRIKLAIESGEASAREGFNALWPVPALGLEAHAWLTDRIQLRGSLVGTRVRFTNPFHEDAGEPQRVEFTYLRIDAGIQVDLSASWGLTVGYARFSMDVTAASRLDDKDRAIFKAGGAFLALDYRF